LPFIDSVFDKEKKEVIKTLKDGKQNKHVI
jgi:hypothetical protein